MKNGTTDQSCTKIMAKGASEVLDSQEISVTPCHVPASQVMTPFGCSNMRHTTPTTTMGGSTGRKKIIFNVPRPRNT